MTRVTVRAVAVIVAILVTLTAWSVADSFDHARDPDGELIAPFVLEQHPTPAIGPFWPTSLATSSTSLIVHRWTWDSLADCESGDWNLNREPIAGTARWDDHRGGYEGGVHFAPSTWDAYRPAGFSDAAYLATRDEQIVVAELVLDDQGPPAWPVCSRKIGMAR